jgi:Cytochrome c554 and c-prime
LEFGAEPSAYSVLVADSCVVVIANKPQYPDSMFAKGTLTAMFGVATLAAGCSPGAPNPLAATSPGSTLTASALKTRPVSRIVGEQRCASSGCHGTAFDGTIRDWHSAYAAWLEEDPHQRAFVVLYSERAVEMYRNLHPESKLSSAPPPDIPYEALLGERCLGCHATGLAGRDVVALAEGGDRPAFYLAGVACEACHGPASAWIHTHYLAGFSRNTPGFHDTKAMNSRAEACVGCHVGPMMAENGRAYDVNHDLIAAGHPRLAFEFASYLANLPKHWDEAKEIASHKLPGEPSTFHIDAWAAGQEQLARQLVRQVEHRLTAAKRDSNTTPWPDFSNFDCYDCHHTIGSPGDKRTTSAQLAGRRNAPRPAIASLAMLKIMCDSSRPAANTGVLAAAGKIETLLQDSWRVPVSKLEQPGAEDLAILTARGQTPIVSFGPQPRHQQLALRLVARMQPWKRARFPGNPQAYRWDLTWDEALQLYLGTLALARDLEWEQPGLLHSAIAPLGVSLDRSSFGRLGRLPTQYDSPTDFDPSSMQLIFDGIEAALISASKFDPRPGNP